MTGTELMAEAAISKRLSLLKSLRELRIRLEIGFERMHSSLSRVDTPPQSITNALYCIL